MKPTDVILPLTAICLMSGLHLLLPGKASAEFYKYKDSSGAVVITNRLEDVPKKYRNKVTVVWDSELEAKDPLAKRTAAATARREQQERQRAAEKAQQAPRPDTASTKGKTLVITLDENTGEVIRRFE